MSKNGGCDLWLLRCLKSALAGFVLDIQIRTKVRYDYSYIKNTVVKINNDTLEVASFGEYYLNGVNNADLVSESIAGYPIKHHHPSEKVHIFEIQLSPGENILVKTYRDMVSVKIENG